MFLMMMVIGLVGLAMMAIPAFARQGIARPLPGHTGALGHGPTVAGHLPPHVSTHALVPAPANPGLGSRSNPELLAASDSAPPGLVRRLLSPRGVFTVLALYGAFGNALVEAFHLPPLLAALVAILPTLLVERFAVRPLWNMVFRLHGRPSGLLGELILNDAIAVVRFRNGRGIVSTNREGRVIQLAARLCAEDAARAVKVGDRLRIEEIDAERERVIVSVLRE